MADDMMDEEDVFTVIPTAPEDMFDSSFENGSTPQMPSLTKLSHSMTPSPLAFTGRPSNGTSMHSTPRAEQHGKKYNTQKTPKEGKNKEGMCISLICNH